MATYSPRVGVTLAGERQDRARRLRHAPQPAQASPPASPITNVEGSGTATGLARRKPRTLSSFDGSNVNLPEDDKSPAKPSDQ